MSKSLLGRGFVALFLLGLIGVLSLVLVIQRQLEEILAYYPELADTPVLVLILLQLITPTLLVLVATLLGCLTAPRVGLVSFVYEKFALGRTLLPRLRPQLGLAVILGFAFAIVVVALDLAFVPFLGPEFQALEIAEIDPLSQLGMGL